MIMIIVLMSTFFNVIFPNCLLLESRGHSPTNTQMGRRRRSQKDESLIDVGGKMYSNESLLFRYVNAALVLSLSLHYVFVTCPMLQCFIHRIVLVASNIKTQGISEAFRKQDTWQNALEGASISEKIEYPHLLFMINDHHSHHILSLPPSSCSQKVENGAESVSLSEKHFIICCPPTIAAAISSYLPSS